MGAGTVIPRTRRTGQVWDEDTQSYYPDIETMMRVKARMQQRANEALYPSIYQGMPEADRQARQETYNRIAAGNIPFTARTPLAPVLNLPGVRNVAAGLYGTFMGVGGPATAGVPVANVSTPIQPPPPSAPWVSGLNEPIPRAVRRALGSVGGYLGDVGLSLAGRAPRFRVRPEYAGPARRGPVTIPTARAYVPAAGVGQEFMGNAGPYEPDLLATNVTGDRTIAAAPNIVDRVGQVVPAVLGRGIDYVGDRVADIIRPYVGGQVVAGPPRTEMVDIYGPVATAEKPEETWREFAVGTQPVGTPPAVTNLPTWSARGRDLATGREVVFRTASAAGVPQITAGPAGTLPITPSVRPVTLSEQSPEYQAYRADADDAQRLGVSLGLYRRAKAEMAQTLGQWNGATFPDGTRLTPAGMIDQYVRLKRQDAQSVAGIIGPEGRRIKVPDWDAFNENIRKIRAGAAAQAQTAARTGLTVAQTERERKVTELLPEEAKQKRLETEGRIAVEKEKVAATGRLAELRERYVLEKEKEGLTRQDANAAAERFFRGFALGATVRGAQLAEEGATRRELSAAQRQAARSVDTMNTMVQNTLNRLRQGRFGVGTALSPPARRALGIWTAAYKSGNFEAIRTAYADLMGELNTLGFETETPEGTEEERG